MLNQREKLEIKQLDPIALPPNLLRRSNNRRVTPHTARTTRNVATVLYHNTRKTISSTINVVNSLGGGAASSKSKTGSTQSANNNDLQSLTSAAAYSDSRKRSSDQGATGFFDSNGHFYRECVDFDAFADNEWYDVLLNGPNQRPRDRVYAFREWITLKFPKLRDAWRYLRLLPDLNSPGGVTTCADPTSKDTASKSTSVSPNEATAASSSSPLRAGSSSALLKTRMEQIDLIAWEFLYQNVVLIMASPGEIFVHQQETRPGQVFFVLNGSCDLSYTPNFLEYLGQQTKAPHQLQKNHHQQQRSPQTIGSVNDPSSPRNVRHANHMHSPSSSKNNNNNNNSTITKRLPATDATRSAFDTSSIVLAGVTGTFRARNVSLKTWALNYQEHVKSVPLKTLGSGDFFGLESVLFRFETHLFSCVSNGALCRNEIGLTTTNCMALFVLPIHQIHRARKLVVERTASALAVVAAAAKKSNGQLIRQASKARLALFAGDSSSHEIPVVGSSKQLLDDSRDESAAADMQVPKRRLLNLKTLSKSHLSFLKRTHHSIPLTEEPHDNSEDTSTPTSITMFPYSVNPSVVQFLSQTFVLRQMKTNRLEFLAASARIVRLKCQDFLFTFGQPVEIFLIKSGQFKVFEEVQIKTTAENSTSLASGEPASLETPVSMNSPRKTGCSAMSISKANAINSKRMVSGRTNQIDDGSDTRKVELEILHAHDLVGLVEACASQKIFKSFCAAVSSSSIDDNVVEALAISPFAWFSALANEPSTCQSVAENLQRHASWYKTRRSTALNHHNTHQELKLSLATQRRGPLQCSRCGWPGHVSISSQCIRANDSVDSSFRQQHPFPGPVVSPHHRSSMSISLQRTGSEGKEIANRSAANESAKSVNSTSSSAQQPASPTQRSMSVIAQPALAPTNANTNALGALLPLRKDRKCAFRVDSQPRLSILECRASSAGGGTLPCYGNTFWLPALNAESPGVDQREASSCSSPVASSSQIVRALNRLNSSLEMDDVPCSPSSTSSTNDPKPPQTSASSSFRARPRFTLRRNV